MQVYLSALPRAADSADTDRLLRYVLGLSGLPKDAARAVTETGKPYLPAFPQFHFSLCHADGFAVCAVDSVPVGVDLEPVRPLRQNIAARYFPPAEQAMVLHRPEAFFELWVIREALAKATGLGLAGILSDAQINFAQEQIDGVDGNWSYALCVPPADNFRFAVCHAGTTPPKPEIHSVDCEEIAPPI